MKFDPQRHHRRSIRLKNYEYTQLGAYVVMPNHVHGIIVINEGPATNSSPDVGVRHASY